MAIDLNPNIVLSSLLKKSVSFFSLDSEVLVDVIRAEQERFFDPSRQNDRRANPRINSGRRHIDLINYF